MVKDGLRGWVHLLFAFIIIGAVIWVFVVEGVNDWQNTWWIAVIALIIIIVILVIISFRGVFHSSSGNGLISRNMKEYTHNYFSRAESPEKHISTSQVNTESEFDIILQAIMKGFKPEPVGTEEEYETQLIKFLNRKFPNRTQREGHTSEGRRVDIVIDGTYSLELIVVNNEGRLISLMDQILKSKLDFSEVAVILVDIDKVSTSKIEEYIEEYKKFGVKTIVKSMNKL